MGVLRPAVVRGLRRVTRLLAVAVVALLGVVLVPQAFADATYVVTSNADTGGTCLPTACTLRAAIAAANTDGQPSTITFGSQMSIAVDSNLPPISQPVTIDGAVSPTIVGVTLTADGNVTQGLELQSGSGGSVIHGLAFAGFQNASPGSAAIVLESDGNTVANDYFGVGSDGSAAAANSTGILVIGNANTIGGSAASAQNVIANGSTGVLVEGAPGGATVPDSNAIQGNLIGLRPNGTPDGNSVGIQVLGATKTLIGVQAAPDELAVVSGHPELSNVIAASSIDGIQIGAGATGTIVTGNFVGPDGSGTGTGAKGNGIHLSNASSNQIGPGNTISHNSGDGVALDGSSIGDRIVANSIHDNAGQGISLTTGANRSLPAPSITSVNGGTASGTVSGPAGSTVFLEFFKNASCDDAANGAGETYLVFTQVTLPQGTGTTAEQWTTAVGGLSVGDGVTATSTNTVTADTSTFSTCVTAQASAGSLSGTVQTDPAVTPPGEFPVDLTKAGSEDWAIWGYANGGTSTSLAPDVRKAGGASITALADIDPGPTAPLRGLGQFSCQTGDCSPFLFGWSDGDSVPTASGVEGGIQHNGLAPTNVSTVGKGFSFSVPADTSTRTLKVYVATNRADGQLSATLSDGSAGAFINTLGAGANVRSAIYTVTYAAASAGQTLNVQWTETADFCNGAGHCDNAALYAVALSGDDATGATAALSSDASVPMSGPNDAISSIPLSAFAPAQPGVTPAPINGLPINGLPINGLPDQRAPDQRPADQRAPDQRAPDQRTAHQRAHRSTGSPSTGCRSTACRSTGSRYPAAGQPCWPEPRSPGSRCRRSPCNRCSRSTRSPRRFATSRSGTSWSQTARSVR